MVNSNFQGSNRIRFEFAGSVDQIMQALAVRAICFVEEKGFPSDVIFDANDFASTHIVAYDGGEPVGSLRIRWFNGFVQFERTCFRKAWRGPRIIKACADFAFRHVRAKGYTRVITHAEPKVARLWRMLLGFEEVIGKEPLTIEGQDGEHYVELLKTLPPLPNPITERTPATVLFQTEGKWTFSSHLEAAPQ